MQYTTQLILTKQHHDPIALNIIPFVQKKQNPDVHIIEEEKSIGIQTVRTTIPLLFNKPFQESHHILIVTHAERMTLEAQNAFLKALEEPPENTQIILISENTESLLPTVLSRCVVKVVSQTEKKLRSTVNHFPSLQEIQSYSMGKRINIVETYTTKREQAIAFIESLIYQAKEELNLHKSDPSYLNILERLITCHTQLSHNVNAKLAVGSLFLHI